MYPDRSTYACVSGAHRDCRGTLYRAFEHGKNVDPIGPCDCPHHDPTTPQHTGGFGTHPNDCPGCIYLDGFFAARRAFDSADERSRPHA